MSLKAAITINRPRDEVERRWRNGEFHPQTIDESRDEVTFKDAPGDRGTEIHLERGQSFAQKAPGIIGKIAGGPPLAKAKDDLRHFKQLVETGEIARSEGSPEGERAERKLKQRPAQPLEESELEKVGA
ncbi:MAG TPA: hypothetical protein VKA89_04815 [Solirubrobacterales bacterium]|nr:hypothetical protein [Solirubrobacterales bacterium]